MIRLTAPQDSSDEQPVRLGWLTSAAITLGAVAVAVAHAVWPAVKIDAITMGLLLLAVAPWLLPVIRTIKVGDVEIGLREVGRQVQEVKHELQELATKVNFVFSGDIAPFLQQRHQQELDKFVAYLKRVGLPTDDHTRIHVGPPSESRYPEAYSAQGAYYEPDTDLVVVGTDRVSDVAVIYRKYMHHVLEKGAPDLAARYRKSERFRKPIGGLWYGLVEFFPCSYRDTPRRDGLNLDNRRSFPSKLSDGEEHDLGVIWGGCFWELRGHSPNEAVDSGIARAWTGIATSKVSIALENFVSLLALNLELVGRPRAATIQVFRDRGLPIDITKIERSG